MGVARGIRKCPGVPLGGGLRLRSVWSACTLLSSLDAWCTKGSLCSYVVTVMDTYEQLSNKSISPGADKTRTPFAVAPTSGNLPSKPLSRSPMMMQFHKLPNGQMVYAMNQSD